MPGTTAAPPPNYKRDRTTDIFNRLRIITAPRLTGLLALVTVLGLAACTGTPTAPTATPQPTETKRAGIWIDREVTAVLDVTKASPARFTAEPQTLRPQAKSDDWVLTLNGITADGDFLAKESRADPLDGAGAMLNSYSRVGFWDRENGFTAVAKTGRETAGPLAGAERQATAMTQAEKHLVWTETPSTDLMFEEWSLRSSQTGELAHSRILKGDARPLPATGGTYPVVIGDWVYWATSQATTPSPDPGLKKDWEFLVLRTRLSGKGKVQRVADNAVMPAAAGDDLVYATYDPASPAVYEIHRKAVSGDGKDEVLVRGGREGQMDITELAASRVSVVWMVSAPKKGKDQMFVLDLRTGEVISLDSGDSSTGPGISFTRTGVLWGTSDRDGGIEYYLNPATWDLFSFAASRGLSVVRGDPAHDTVMWVEGRDPRTRRGLWHVAELQTAR
jgi:hypothetical protein